MAAPVKPARAHPVLRRRLILAAVAALAVWLAFFDSHSLYKRVRWHHEAARLRAENEALRQQTEDLSEKLAEGLSDEVVEQIAREQYGMRRPGETVYRVEAE